MPDSPTPDHNQFAYSVSEIAFAVKRVVEDNFGQVRVRGEISGWRGPHSSGHAYFRLKDDKAVLEAVCWRGSLSKMSFKLEEGLEVIATGRITTYPGSSKYQIVIDSIEPAGIGALMALLEKRKAMLAAEGLFDEKRKRPLPFMPRVIGVITSPTGAVIRDILHRLSDRFPCHVLVWPVAVQGEGAAEQVAAAIEGFNTLGSQEVEKLRSPEIVESRAFPISGLLDFPTSTLPRPDLLIVARGGGSLEDLWAFNEEVVVRAVAASRIPLISAVGHETDTTLIDYASDRRAPTPTAAAEMAVPVLADWLLTLRELYERMLRAALQGLAARNELVNGFARGLPHPRRMMETALQLLDDRSERLTAAGIAIIEQRSQKLAVIIAKLQPQNVAQALERHGTALTDYAGRMMRLIARTLADRQQKLDGLFQLMESLSPTRVLERGFVLVKDAQGTLITRVAAMGSAPHTLIFHDGERTVQPIKKS